MSDREILELFHESGNPEKAFSLLVKKYDQKIYWHIRRMVTYHEDADDVMQNVFIKIWTGLANFRAESQLYTWIYRIATNECLSFLEQRKKKGTLGLELPEGEEGLNLSEKISADPWFDGDAAQAKLLAALSTLPDKQKLVFQMRYYDEITYEQMSEVLGTSVGALKASYHHAIKKIEDFLSKH